MKRTSRYIILSLVVILVLLVGVRLWRKYSSLDGLSAMFWGSLPYMEDTEYAPGYNENGFKRVTLGMRREDVYKLIGEPLQTWENKDASISERWSKSPSDIDYRHRVIIFRDGVVETKYAEYYHD